MELVHRNVEMDSIMIIMAIVDLVLMDANHARIVLTVYLASITIIFNRHLLHSVLVQQIELQCIKETFNQLYVLQLVPMATLLILLYFLSNAVPAQQCVKIVLLP